MATPSELSKFLELVERRAFKQAMFAVRDEDAALDIVQDAMLKLAHHYSERPCPELPLLFQRILQNTIHDYFRRKKTLQSHISNFSEFTTDEDEALDPLEFLIDASAVRAVESASDEVERMQTMASIEEEISKLPARQREAFLMRYWEELDVAETAAVMGCTEGSVKTHCSRAVHALAKALQARGMK